MKKWVSAVGRSGLLWLAMGAAGALVAACDGCRSSAPPATVSATTPEPPPTLRVYFVSDLAGAIEPCGCMKDQLGGLAHAAAWVEAQRQAAPASLLVTAGPTFFMDPILEPDHRSQDVAKAEAIAGSLRRLGFAGWAPAKNDWAGGAPEVAKLTQVSGGACLGANLAGDAGAPLLPTKIVTVDALKVAFVGVATGVGDGASGGSRPIAESVRAAVAAARASGANLVIALASVGRGEAKRIADAVPDLAAIVVGSASGRGDSNTQSPPPERVGNVLIAETANHLQTVGAIDFYVRGGSYEFADAVGLELSQKRAELARRIDELHVRISNWERDRTISAPDLAARRADLSRLEADKARLDRTAPPAQGSYFRYTVQEVRDALGQDPSVKAAMTSYYRQVNEANRIQLEGRLPTPVQPGQAGYVGVERCATCHASEKKFWDKTRHAQAYVSLSEQSKEFNLDCVGCHVTGYGHPGGSTVTHVDALKDVQCEVCHGPGSLHVAAPKDKPLTMPAGELCTGCHHPPHVEGFDVAAKMNAIVGPGHGG